jgi:sarcosine oxidase
MTAPAQYDVIVLGLGGIGSGAAYWLAKRGARVLGLEGFEFGHLRGESHDHSRIIRLSYHTPDYVRLARAAYAAWSELERDTGETFVTRTGGLDLGPRDGAIPLADYAASMRACGVPFEKLDAATIRERWPAFRIGDDVHGLFQADGGIVAAARGTAAHQRAARALGADLRDNAPVTTLHDRGGEIHVEAGGAAYRARKLVIAAGPWSARMLAAFDVRIPLEVIKEQVTYFAPPEPESFAPDRFPVWIWMDDPSFYGFPSYAGAGVKVAQDAGGKAVDPDTRGFEADPDISARMQTFLERHLPGVLGPELVTKTCLYTLTPDRDFVLDRLAEHPAVCVAIGAGHAFKFASVLGRALAELALDERSHHALPAFALDRPILRMSSPPTTYMV